jgi:cyclophilin family peptidyl-prolyl cis-trans isomerase
VFASRSASSQVFFLLKESELTPSGANLLDGRYAVFGYVTSGQDNLGIFKVCSRDEAMTPQDKLLALSGLLLSLID